MPVSIHLLSKSRIVHVTEWHSHDNHVASESVHPWNHLALAPPWRNHVPWDHARSSSSEDVSSRWSEYLSLQSYAHEVLFSRTFWHDCRRSNCRSLDHWAMCVFVALLNCNCTSSCVVRARLHAWFAIVSVLVEFHHLLGRDNFLHFVRVSLMERNARVPRHEEQWAYQSTIIGYLHPLFERKITNDVGGLPAIEWYGERARERERVRWRYRDSTLRSLQFNLRLGQNLRVVGQSDHTRRERHEDHTRSGHRVHLIGAWHAWSTWQYWNLFLI